jgi:hypothetical protein
LFAGTITENAEGILLYPRTKQTFAPDFTTDGHRIRAPTLDLTQDWQSIHKALMGFVGLTTPA